VDEQVWVGVGFIVAVGVGVRRGHVSVGVGQVVGVRVGLGVRVTFGVEVCGQS